MKLPPMIRLFGALLFLLVLCGEARADYQGLLLLGSPFQGVRLDYDFRDYRVSGDRFGTASSDENRFTETYFISLPFALLSRNIFDGKLNLSARYMQDYFSPSSGTSSSDSTYGLSYGLSGVFTKHKPFTLYVNASSSRDWTQQEFSPGYDTTLNVYGATAYYKNPVIPMMFRYVHSDSEMDKQTGVQTNSYDTMTFTASNTFRNVFTTSLGLAYTSARNSLPFSLTQTSESLGLDLGNSYSWIISKGTPGYVTTDYSYQQTTADSTKYDSYSLSASLYQMFGRALTANASVSRSTQQGLLFSDDTTSGKVWLSHKLYDSLRTDITLQGTSDNFPTGKRNEADVSGTISYQKRLPLDSSLSLAVGGTYSWQEEKSANAEKVQFNEKITITDLGKRYLLAKTDVTAIVEVWNVAHTLQYFSPADWDIFRFGDRTYLTINPAGQIHTGDTIVVTYQYRTDPNLTTADTSVFLSGNLYLYGGFLRFFANISESQHSFLSGTAMLTPLGQSTTVAAGAESKFAGHTVGTRYDGTDDPRSSRSSIAGYWRYGGSVGQNQYSLSLADTYGIWTDKASGKDTWNNVISASGTISRAFTQSSQGTIVAGYLGTSGDIPQQNLYVTLNYGITMGKLRFTLTARSLLNSNNRQTTLSNGLNLSLARFFF